MEEDRCDGRRKGMGYGAVDRLAVAPRVKGVEGRLGGWWPHGTLSECI